MQVTRIARHMVTRWGISNRIGPLNFGEGEEPTFAGTTHAYSDATAQLIDDEVRAIVESCLDEARSLLE
jgi:cell division protease FtsH